MHTRHGQISWQEMYNTTYLPSHYISDTLSLHFNHFYCTEIFHKLKRDMAMLTHTYLDVDECWLISSVPSKVLSIILILNKMRFLDMLLMAMLALTWSGCISLCSYQAGRVWVHAQLKIHENIIFHLIAFFHIWVYLIIYQIHTCQAIT